MRAALFSIRVRVDKPESTVFRAFDSAFTKWELGFLTTKVLLQEFDPMYDDQLREARGYAQQFREIFYDDALERAADSSVPPRGFETNAVPRR
jgi:hypothetical protein